MFVVDVVDVLVEVVVERVDVDVTVVDEVEKYPVQSQSSGTEMIVGLFLEYFNIPVGIQPLPMESSSLVIHMKTS